MRIKVITLTLSPGCLHLRDYHAHFIQHIHVHVLQNLDGIFLFSSIALKDHLYFLALKKNLCAVCSKFEGNLEDGGFPLKGTWLSYYYYYEMYK